MLLRLVENLKVGDQFYFPNENKNTIAQIYIEPSDYINLMIDCAGKSRVLKLYRKDMVLMVHLDEGLIPTSKNQLPPEPNFNLSKKTGGLV